MVFAMLSVVVVVGILSLRAFRNRDQPRARFYSGKTLSVTWRHISAHGRYWVEWGEDVWHIHIDRIEGATDSSLRERILEDMVAFALRGPRKRKIYINDVPVIAPQKWPNSL
jgi:hypothetical protein